MPLLIPITEPAEGYGAVAALVFIDRNTPDQGQRFTRPNVTVAGGLATQNDTRGYFAGHFGTWQNGRLRTQAALADADINLDYFGLGGNRPSGDPTLPYTIAASGGMVGAAYRVGDGPLWLGMRYALVDTITSLAHDAERVPGTYLDNAAMRLGALTPSLTLDPGAIIVSRRRAAGMSICRCRYSARTFAAIEISN